MAETTIAPEEKPKKKWRYGTNRWFILLFIILGVVAARAYSPVLPHIQLPAERYSPTPLFTLPLIGEFYWTNTLTAMVLVDLILLAIALSVRSAIKSGKQVLDGFAGAVETILELIYNLTESTAGKYAKKIFPWFATITLMVLVSNWMELIPGVDSIGILEHAEHGHSVQSVLGFAKTLVKDGGEHGETFMLIPYVRTLSTDLNFTVALALISVFMTQVIGLQARGVSYFSKFFNVKGLFSKPIFGVIDFGVGLLEIVSEVSKILSFSFRLLGNIFAGTVLLFVIGSLVPVFAQSFFQLLEFFVGLIQALVFGMLTMMFMAQATHGH
ncbi:MAG: F0F1 ATP synthase subunit A [Anaerolineales bacterium]